MPPRTRAAIGYGDRTTRYARTWDEALRMHDYLNVAISIRRTLRPSRRTQRKAYRQRETDCDPIVRRPPRCRAELSAHQ